MNEFSSNEFRVLIDGWMDGCRWAAGWAGRWMDECVGWVAFQVDRWIGRQAMGCREGDRWVCGWRETCGWMDLHVCMDMDVRTDGCMGWQVADGRWVEPSQYRATIALPAKRHSNGVSLEGRWRPLLALTGNGGGRNRVSSKYSVLFYLRIFP